jgi:hypothetical protein
MSEAARIAGALDGKPGRGRLGVYYRCRCPLPTHGNGRGDHDRSLSVRDGDSRVLLHCFTGCPSDQIFAVLLRRGLLERDYRGQGAGPQCEAIAPETLAITPDSEARATWCDSAPAAGTIIETAYLRRVRGITVAPPPSLRYSQQPFQNRVVLPAMVAAVQAPDRKLIACQLTYLDCKTFRRFERRNVGALGLGAVRLAAATETLGLAEGVETALAAMQIHGVPVWATLGAPRIASIVVPDTVRELIIFGDNDGPGRDAAEAGVRSHTCKGRRVVPCFPPAHCKDWAEVVTAQKA